ncbi:MAG: cation:dicarboxylase symporter family transporter [Acidobacteria bacterium]|nr:MAG: cation:dicarboxylase symporter family transporter [Acidobacteriota bacterium]
MKEGTRVLVALAAAIIVGALIAASGNAAALRVADSVAPIGSLWISAIRMTVLPLIASLIVTGIASAADGKSLGRLGVRTVAVFVLMLAGMAAIIVPLARLAFTIFPDGARPALPPGAAQTASEVAGAGQAHSFSAWLSTLLPANPIAAAANGDMVPFVLFVLLLAIAIAKSPAASRATLVGFFRALGDAMMTLVRGVILLAPIGVPALVLPVAAHAGASLVGTIGLYIVMYSAACLFCVALLYPVVALAGGISISRFAKAVLPGQTIAFSSSSSVASLPALVRAAEVDLALPLEVTGFTLPLAAAMFKIAGPVTWTVGALFVGWFYNVPLGVGALATIAFASVFLAFAAPGIPRGGFIMLTPLLVAVGLPAEGVGLLIAVDAIPDVFATVLNATGYLAATCVVAGRAPRLT